MNDRESWLCRVARFDEHGNFRRTVEMPYCDYLASPWWRFRRLRYIAGHWWSCEKCGGGPPGLQVHHLSYEHLGCEPDDDLQSLCDDCHTETTESDRARRART